MSIDDLTEGKFADALVTLSLGKRSDCSAGCHVTIKAVRRISTHAGVAALRVAWTPLIESFLRSRIPKEMKESIPFSLYTVVQLERRILTSSCSIVDVVLLGAVLACIWSGLRFADAQRCSYSSLCYGGSVLRGSCWRTKTSHRGQPWGLMSSGLLSLGSYSWVDRWLQTLDQLWQQAKSTDSSMPVPDFFFPQIGANGVQIPWAPMSYADALSQIRRLTALPWKADRQLSGHWTAHSMKSTLLSWGAQLAADGKIQPEERLLQGHHRQGGSTSLRIYSRDDVHGQLSFQKKIIDHVRKGGRFLTPQHRGSQPPLSEPSVQVEFFRKTAAEYQWKCFNFTGQQPTDQPAQVEDLDAQVSDSSSSDSSSGSDSSSESATQTPVARPPKKSRNHLNQDPPDELVVAHMTAVQHAMLACDKDWTQYLDGVHFESACGARLDPDRTMLSREANPKLQLCQRQACVRVWKALLL